MFVFAYDYDLSEQFGASLDERIQLLLHPHRNPTISNQTVYP